LKMRHTHEYRTERFLMLMRKDAVRWRG